MVNKNEAIAQLEALIQQRAFKDAIEKALEFLQTFPDDPDLIKLRDLATERLEAEPFLQNFMTSGMSLFNSGLYDEALKQFEKVAAIDPHYPELDEWMNRCKEKLSGSFVSPSSHHPQAESPPAEEISPTRQKIQQLLQQGQNLFDQGKYNEAIQVWSEIFMYDLTNTEAQKRIQEAQRALQQKRQDVESILADLRQAMKENQIDRAEELIAQVLSIDPNNEEALRFKRTIESRETAGVGVEEELPSGEQLDSLVMEALRAHREQQWAEAVRLWQEVLKAEPDNMGAQSKYSEALRMLRIENQLNRLLDDARIFMASDKKDSAIHALQKAYRLRPDHPQVRNLMLEWNLTEADLEEIMVPPESSAVKAEGAPGEKRRPTSLILLVAGIVIIGAGIVVAYTQFFQKKEPKVATVEPKRRQVIPPSRRPSRPTQPASPHTNQPENPPQDAQPSTAQTSPGQPTAHELTSEEIKQRDEWLKKAMELRSTDVDSAYAAIKEAYAIDPYHPDVSRLYHELHSIVTAREQEIQEALENAQRYSRQYDFTGAIFVLNRVRSRYPERKEIIQLLKRAYFNLGLYYLRQVRCNDAIDVFEQIELMDPRAEKELLRFLPLARQCVEQNGLKPEQEDLVYNTPFLELVIQNENAVQEE